MNENTEEKPDATAMEARDLCPKCKGTHWYQLGNLRCCFNCAEGFIVKPTVAQESDHSATANDAMASDTPRSDDIRIGADQTAIVQLFKHARQLERELNEAKETIATWITSDKRSAELSTLRREKAELWAALEEMHKCFFDPAENESKPGTWGAAACDKATAILAATKEKEEGK